MHEEVDTGGQVNLFTVPSRAHSSKCDEYKVKQGKKEIQDTKRQSD